MDLGLESSAVLVTGASGGIGAAIARALAAEGARVAVHYHSNRASA
jgi:3-oxoacyl-[acyl-carrier protein] reductase